MARKQTAPNVKTSSATDLARKATRITESYKNNSWQSRWNRRAANLANWNAYWSRQDWSHKLPWQTQQTVADFGMSIEQSTGTLERGLTDTEDWLTAEPVGIGEPLIDPDTIAQLLKYYLDRLWVPGDQADQAYSFAALIGDGIKRGLLESILTFKIVPKVSTKFQYMLATSEPQTGELGYRETMTAYDLTKPGITGAKLVKRVAVPTFRLAIELVPWEDWFPDPSMQNKYCIHEVTMHLSALSANPGFDPDVVKAIRGTASATYADQYKRMQQGTVFIQHDPDEVRVQECWGDLIDPDTGEVLATNSFWTVCNGQLLRPPTPNPFWHGKRPFVSSALLRNPNSTVHKAVADDAVNTWQFLNELVSLMFDGALGSVWGKHQMRTDYVENVDDFQEGIPQAATFVLRPNTPEGYKALERIDSGELPQYAMEIFNLAMREFQTAMATNDLRLGQQPPKEATATSIVESMQASGSLFESIAARVEDNQIDPTLELAWLTILQYEFPDKYIDPVLVQILGPERVLKLAQLDPEDRFVLLAQAAKFKCRGLRGVTARSRTLTKLANVLQLMGSNPQFAAAYQQKYSFQRLAETILRASGINVVTLEKTQQEKQQDQAQQMVQEAMQESGAQPAQPGGAPGGAQPPGPPAANGGSPPALLNAGQDQLGSTGPDAMAPKTPAGVPGGAPQPQGG